MFFVPLTARGGEIPSYFRLRSYNHHKTVRHESPRTVYNLLSSDHTLFIIRHRLADHSFLTVTDIYKYNMFWSLFKPTPEHKGSKLSTRFHATDELDRGPGPIIETDPDRD